MLRSWVAGVGSLAICLAAASGAQAECGGGMGTMVHDHGESASLHEGHERPRSPGLAVALSLTPVPVDFGNLYAENIGWGIAYTAAQLALAVPMMWSAGSHMGSGYAGSSSWSISDRNTLIVLASGYVAVKLVAGLHAAHAVEGFNRAQQRPARLSAVVVPAAGGAAAFASLRF